MPDPIHLELEGSKQGKIEGSCAMKGREGSILVNEYHHTIRIPTSPQTGQAMGKRIHEPVTFTKCIDKASPKLRLACVSGERLKHLTFSFFRINQMGVEEHYYTVKLENAVVVSAKQWFPNVLDKPTESYGHMETVQVTYERITETHEIDKLEMEDSWNEPKS